MIPTVYIETTIVSYLVSKPSRDLIIAAHQQLTQTWWQERLQHFDTFVSPIVLDEISKGDQDAAKARLNAVRNIKILEATQEVFELGEHYYKRLKIPNSAKPDAYHLAIATWHGMDFMVTWNCSHLANGKIKRYLEDLNDERGFRTPIICTPEELLEG